MAKKLNDEGNYTQLTVGELREMIADIADETEVIMVTCRNPFGGIVEAGAAIVSSYGFMGSSVPCVVIEPASNGYIARDEIRQRRFAPKPTD